MSPIVVYRERVIECLTLARSTNDAQTRRWAIELASLLDRLARRAENKTGADKDLGSAQPLG